MKANLVCKGGGVKGIGIVGAICYLENQGYVWENIAGTSVGAIIASLLAAGYSGFEIKDMLYNLDYTKLKDKSNIHKLPIISDIFSLLFYKGLYTGNYIESFLQEKMQIKGVTKFKHISTSNQSKLKIFACDVSRKKLLTLPDDLVYYGINPMEFDISKAVRMSFSIPLYYRPIKIKYNKKNYFIVDGGLLSNFPIWIFDSDVLPEYPTFGLNLLNDKSYDTSKYTGTISYLLDVVQTSINTNEDVYFSGKDFARIINIPTLDISAFNFNISQKEMEALYNSGYESAQSFIASWDFKEYISRHCL